jgi:DNA-directed RNA polymerase subunit L
MDSFYIAERTDKSVKIMFKGTDTTIVNPIMDELDRDSDVKIVRYINIHPELKDPALYVETKSKDPVEVVAEAAERVSEYFSAINQ